MATNRIIMNISTILLRIGVILFVFSHLYETGLSIQSNNDFGNYFLEIILLLVFVGLSVVLIVLSKTKFEVFGFFLVFIGSLFSLLNTLFTNGIRPELSIHFLLLVVSINYFLKSRRGNRKKIVTIFE